MPEWSFLTNHVLVLGLLAKQPRTTAREMATAIGITERAVRRIIADLDAAGYIGKKKEGRGSGIASTPIWHSVMIPTVWLPSVISLRSWAGRGGASAKGSRTLAKSKGLRPPAQLHLVADTPRGLFPYPASIPGRSRQ